MLVDMSVFKTLSVMMSILLVGCISMTPKDVYFTNVELINVKEVTAREIDNGRYMQKSGYIPRLKVSVKSHANLLNLYSENHLWPRVKASFCDKPKEDVLMARGVYFDEDLLGDLIHEKYIYQKPVTIEKSDNGLYEYQIHLALYSPDFEGNHPYQKYDLVTNPKDVCVVLEGRTMFKGMVSNRIVVSKSKIQNALAVF